MGEEKGRAKLEFPSEDGKSFCRAELVPGKGAEVRAIRGDTEACKRELPRVLNELKKK